MTESKTLDHIAYLLQRTLVLNYQKYKGKDKGLHEFLQTHSPKKHSVITWIDVKVPKSRRLRRS